MANATLSAKNIEFSPNVVENELIYSVLDTSKEEKNLIGFVMIYNKELVFKSLNFHSGYSQSQLFNIYQLLNQVKKTFEKTGSYYYQV